jgi:hypothetical protein
MAAPPDIVRRVFRRLLARKQGADPKTRQQADAESLLGLMEQARDSPLDSELCYELGIALLRKDNDNDGVRYLERSFRLDPLNVVRFVRAPDLKQVRLRKSVVSLMSQLRREEEQRFYGAYA